MSSGLMLHCSDWPEAGLRSAAVPASGAARALPTRHGGRVSARATHGNLELELLARVNTFESALYDRPVVSLRLMARCAQDPLGVLAAPAAQPAIRGLVARVLSGINESDVYVCAKVVAGEPLHMALESSGFPAVEHRRVFVSNAEALAHESRTLRPNGIEFVALADPPGAKHDECRRQLLEICAQAFAQGHSRHFRDTILSSLVPGVEYIRAVMQLNFDTQPASGFLIAVDPSRERVCGFSIVGTKADLVGHTCTQLLSAVRPEYRGRGVYRGLTRLLAARLPPDATLVNVTQSGSERMLRAYAGGGRKHLADTVVVRAVRGERWP